MPHARFFLGVVALSILGTTTQAQTASALLREGDLLAGAPAGHIVGAITGTGANNNGGFVVEVNTSNGGTTLSHAWGSSNGFSPSILQTEATYGPLVQTSFEQFIGVANNGTPCYSASGTGGAVGGFDSVWLGSTPIAVQGDANPNMPGTFWVFGSRPGVTGTGVPYFVGGVTNTLGGGTQIRGLFYGVSPVALIKSGDLLPNMPEPLSVGSSVSFDYRVSTLGTNYITEVQMSGPLVSTIDDDAMVIGGVGLMLGGSLVQEGKLVPISIGGNGSENWDIFDNTGISESGDYFFTGETDGNTATDEIIVHNGVIRFREGDVVDSETLTGSIEGAAMNESGQIAYVWDIEDGLGGSLEALFFEDNLMLLEGDEVDWDGDGNIDAGYVVTGFSGIASISVGSNSVIFFTAEIDTNGGGEFRGFFKLAGTLLFQPFCFGDNSGTVCPCGNAGVAGEGCANSTGLAASLNATGEPLTTSDTIVFHTTQAPPSTPGLFFQGAGANAAGALFGDGLLCTTGQIIRLGVVFTDVFGNADSNFSVSGLGLVNPGDLRFYQYWYRDTPGPCSTGFNTTNALSVQW